MATPEPSLRRDTAPSTRVLPLLDEQRRRWRAGERPTVEDYLRLYPELATDRDGLLDLLYSEVLLREQRGEALLAEEYRQRFPQHADAVTRLLVLHRVLSQASLFRNSPTATVF